MHDWPLSSLTRRSHPRRSRGRFHRRVESAPRVRGLASRALASAAPSLWGSSGLPGRQREAMAATAPVPKDDEDRLAALWEQPLDDHVIDATDDTIAALFSAPDVDAPRATSGRRTSSSRLSDARWRSGGGRRGRSRPRRAHHPDPSRSAVVGVGLLAALVLSTVALDGMTGSTDNHAPDSSTSARRAAAPDPPARPAPGTLGPRRGQSREPHPQRGDARRARAARSRRTWPRSRQRPKAASAPARRPALPSRPRSEPAATPSTVASRRIPGPIPASSSSACDEFPPC